jgi:hypothetical protein
LICQLLQYTKVAIPAFPGLLIPNEYKLEQLKEIFFHVLQNVYREEIFVVIYGLGWSSASKALDLAEGRETMEFLHMMMWNSGCRVKVLLTAPLSQSTLDYGWPSSAGEHLDVAELLESVDDVGTQSNEQKPQSMSSSRYGYEFLRQEVEGLSLE